MARTGRYKWLLVGAIVVMAVAMALMTQLRSDTPLPIVWLWMFIAGLGVGPTFAVFTLVVQNAVPFNMLGVATSNLTFFRQIGGTVALAIVGHRVRHRLPRTRSPRRWRPRACPMPLVTGFHAGHPVRRRSTPNQLTGTGDLGQAILANAGPAAAQIAPFVDKIVIGIHNAFSLAIAQSFWIGDRRGDPRRDRRRGHAGAGPPPSTPQPLPRRRRRPPSAVRRPPVHAPD